MNEQSDHSDEEMVSDDDRNDRTAPVLRQTNRLLADDAPSQALYTQIDRSESESEELHERTY